MGYKRATKKSRAIKRRIPRAVARIPMPEIKHSDGVGGPSNVTPNGIIMQVNGLAPQGTDFTNRIGRRIKVLRTEINMQYFASTAGVPASGSSLRCIVVLDNEVRGLTPGVTDILDVTGLTGTMSMMNANNLRRFKVVHDHMYPITNLNGTQASMMASCRSLIKKRFEINFTSAGNAVGDVLDNLMWMVLIGDASAAATVVVSANMRSRTWYHDA